MKRSPAGVVSQDLAPRDAAEGRPDPPPLQGPASGSLAEAILTGNDRDVERSAKEWAAICSRDIGTAVFEAISLTLELAGLPGAVSSTDLEAQPSVLLARLPEWVRDQQLDPTIYPLLPTARRAKQSVLNFEKFWAKGLADQNGAALLDSQLVTTLRGWLLELPNATIRSLRHSATVAALAVAEALSIQQGTLQRAHETLFNQLESSRGSINQRQESQLKRDVHQSAAHARDMGMACTQLLEIVVPRRGRDVSEVIRLYTLDKVDRLMMGQPDSYVKGVWTARVFLMVHDPCAEVRLKAISVIQHWYAPNRKRSAAVQEHLETFAQKSLSHLVERVADIDARVAAAALRCLGLPALAERLKDDEFDTLVNLVIGSRETLVREEAALFINAHVFQEPGICTKEKPKKRGGDGSRDDAGIVGEDDRDDPTGGDTLRELYNSETSLSMLVEYLENYMGDKLRITERVVEAFWPRAPSLAHWSTMVNLCLVGESQGPGRDPITPKQRLALLYIMEAAVRRANSDVVNARNPSEKDAASLKMNEACVYIIPEMPRLLDMCRPEEQNTLLLSHTCKMLIEYAVDNSQSQVLVNAKALCITLRKAIEGQSPMDTSKYCADSLLALARNFDEAKTTFLDLTKSVHHQCVELLKPEGVAERFEELRPVMSCFMVLANRGIDMSFGNMPMLEKFVDLLESRVPWMKEKAAAAAAATEAGEAIKEETEPEITAEDGSRAKRRRKGARPEGVPDVRLALQLIESACISVMWHVRMAFWVELKGAQSAEDKDAAESQVTEMLQGFGNLSDMRAKLPEVVTRLRAICIELIQNDQSVHIKFHAYYAYMCLLQIAIGVSDKFTLEVDPGGLPAGPTGWGATFEVRLPKEHQEVLWNYLNNFYQALSDVDSEGVTFNSEGHRIDTQGRLPSPSQGTMTSVRFLAYQCIEAPGEDPEALGTLHGLPRVDELMLAVLVSRAVLESELDDVYEGPLGLLLLTQCDRGRPRPLREVALNLLRRLRSQTETEYSEEYAIQFFAMQHEAVESVFRCSGVEAAISLSSTFTRVWGIKMSEKTAHLERPLYVVLKEAVISCVTADKLRLPLLDAYIPWIKADFVQDSRCKEIADELLRRCASLGLDGEYPPQVVRMLKKLRQLVPLEEEGFGAGDADEVEITSVTRQPQPSNEPPPGVVCGSCGTFNLPESNFCRNCGHKLEVQPSSGSGTPGRCWKMSAEGKARAMQWVERLKTDES